MSSCIHPAPRTGSGRLLAAADPIPTTYRILCAIVALAAELTAWVRLLALADHPARRWEPERLRLLLFSVAGRLARSGRRTVLHLSAHAPWAVLLLRAITTLRTLAAPG